MIEGVHYHRSMNELDCIFDFDRIEAEMAGGDLTAKEAYEGARLQFLGNCQSKQIDFINRNDGRVDG